MRRFRSGAAFVSAALLLTYAVAIPLLITMPAAAHKLRNRAGTWQYSVVGRQLDYRDSTRYDNKLDFAREAWNDRGPITLRETGGQQAEVRVLDSDPNCQDYRPYLGIYSSTTDRIFLNVCLMEWDGGNYQGFDRDQYRAATQDIRRTRTVVHELGHALGLDHNDLDQCVSVMVDLRSDYLDPCRLPGTHDTSDLNNYWP